MNYEWHDLLGNIGVLLVLLAYLLVQLNRIDTRKYLYSAVNAAGATLLCISLFINFNMSGLIIEIAWVLISLFGLYRCFSTSRTGSSGP